MDNPNYNLTKERKEALHSEWNSFTLEVKREFRAALIGTINLARDIGMSPELFLFEVNNALEPEEEMDFEEEGGE
jgi:hypothetical protein